MEMEDEYEDYEDEYVSGEEDGEEYEDEEEDPRQSKEALEYLELRQRLKEQIRKKNKKIGGPTLNHSSDRKRKLPYDNYGSFFGPSQPVISQRVIQESKSVLENHLTTKMSNPVQPKKVSTTSTTSGSKPGVPSNKSKVGVQAKNTAQKLKQTRDYSFLLSDDAELPAPRSPKAAPQRSTPVLSSEARRNPPIKSRHVPANGVRHASGDYGERRQVSSNGHMNSKTGSNTNKLPSTSRPNSTQMDSRRSQSSINGTGPGRPLEPRSVPSKVSTPLERKVKSLIPKMSAPAPRMQQRVQLAPKFQPPSRSQLPLKSHPSSHSQLPSKSQPSSKLQHSSKSQPPSASRHHMEQRREHQGLNRPKVLPRQQAGLSRPQRENNRPLMKQNSTRHRSRSPDRRPKKKPMRRHSDGDDNDGEDPLSMIRQMFGYNPNKYVDRDDDDSGMEANFEDIMREEKYSARVARKEDDEQLRLIQEEERRERLAKLKKQRRN